MHQSAAGPFVGCRFLPATVYKTVTKAMFSGYNSTNYQYAELLGDRIVAASTVLGVMSHYNNRCFGGVRFVLSRAIKLTVYICYSPPVHIFSGLAGQISLVHTRAPHINVLIVKLIGWLHRVRWLAKIVVTCWENGSLYKRKTATGSKCLYSFSGCMESWLHGELDECPVRSVDSALVSGCMQAYTMHPASVMYNISNIYFMES